MGNFGIHMDVKVALADAKSFLVRLFTPLFVILIGFAALITVFMSYVYNFAIYSNDLCASKSLDCLRWFTFSSDRSAWGQFGDFVGGVVNPIFGFLTICLLVVELRATRRAAEEAKNAQESTEKALRDQLTEAKSQNDFANYYKHLEEFRKYVSECYPDQNVIDIDARRLHAVLYPSINFTEDLYKNSIKNRRQLQTTIKDLCGSMTSLIESGFKDIDSFLTEFRVIHSRHLTKFENILRNARFELIKINIKGTIYEFYGASIHKTVESLVDDCIVLNKIQEFEPAFGAYMQSDEMLKTLRNAGMLFPRINVNGNSLSIVSDTRGFVRMLAELQMVILQIESFEQGQKKAALDTLA